MGKNDSEERIRMSSSRVGFEATTVVRVASQVSCRAKSGDACGNREPALLLLALR